MKTLKVMTYNIRNAYGDTGENAWDNRKESLAGLISGREPDIFCVQEAYDSQISFLLESLPEYGFAGVGRDDGKTEGEYSAVYFKKDRFELLSQRTRWLSESPDVPSIGWDAHHKRICTSALLLERDGERLCAASVHLDHAGILARKNGAELLRSFFAGGPEQCFIAGDYNAVTGSEPYNILNAPPFCDARLFSEEYSDFGTFHGYGRVKTVFENSPIDHIFITKGAYTPVRAEILSVKRNGHFPSDHFPLMISFTAK
jgi:endonuclease/exonuclease/phosphatase family metal-dependent hydrolase